MKSNDSTGKPRASLQASIVELISRHYDNTNDMRQAVKHAIIPHMITELIQKDCRHPFETKYVTDSKEKLNAPVDQENEKPGAPKARFQSFEQQKSETRTILSEISDLQTQHNIKACFLVNGSGLPPKTRFILKIKNKGQNAQLAPEKTERVLRLLAQGSQEPYSEPAPREEPFEDTLSWCIRKLALTKLNYQSSLWRLRCS